MSKPKPNPKPASVKAPRVRWARVRSVKASHSEIRIGSVTMYSLAMDASAAAEFEGLFNRELSRLVAARDKRRAVR